jgi:titin
VSGPAINLAWTDNATNETGFVIERAVNGGAFASYAMVSSNVTTYQDTAVSYSTTYSYRVMAQNAQGNSPYSNVATVTVTAPVAAPTNLTATIYTNPNRVQLIWTDNATNETGFVIERSVNGGAFTTLANVGARAGTGSTNYMDSSVTAGNSYSYRVAALLGAAKSAYSNTVSVSLTLPAAPSNVTAVAFRAGPGTDRVVLTWTDNANNETSFQIQRSTNATFTTNVVSYTAGANSTTWQNTGVARGTSFYYRIRAVNAFGNSAWVNATPFPITTP